MNVLIPLSIIGFLVIVYILFIRHQEKMSDATYIQDLKPSLQEIKGESDNSLEGLFASQLVKEKETPLDKVKHIIHHDTLDAQQVKERIEAIVSKTPKVKYDFKLVEIGSFTQTRDGSMTVIATLHDIKHNFTREFVFMLAGGKLVSVKLNMNETDMSGIKPVFEGTKNLNSFAEWTPPI
jgi:hypothetical protein